MRIAISVPRLASAAAAALLFVSLGGCARSDPTIPTPGSSTGTSAGSSPSPTTGATDQRVVVERTGGIAGVQDTIVVEPDGHWTRGSNRTSSGAGQLSEEQRSQLQTLANSPKLRAEATRKVSTGFVCSDGFKYTVTVGETKVSYEQCGGNSSDPETASAIVSLVMSATRVT